MPRTLLALTMPFLFGGCVLGAFEGPGTFDRYYAVGMIRDSIDDTARREAAGRAPIPHRDGSAASWRWHWESWFETWRESSGSVRRSAEELVAYSLQRRRELGL